MAIVVPVAGDPLKVETFGKPVADSINTLIADVDALEALEALRVTARVYGVSYTGKILIIADSFVASTDGNGRATVTFPTPFATQPLVVGTTGDNLQQITQTGSATTTVAQFWCRWTGGTGDLMVGTTVRINYIAVGTRP